MKYCPNCKTASGGEVCTECQGQLREITDDDWVLLAIDKEYELNNLCSHLSAANLEFQLDSGKVSAGSVMSRGFKNEGKLYVRYRDYESAKGIARVDGFHFPDDAVVTPIPDASEGKTKKKKVAYSDVAGQKNPEEVEDEKSKKKSKLGKVILYGSIVVAMIIVVLLADLIINAIKGAF